MTILDEAVKARSRIRVTREGLLLAILVAEFAIFSQLSPYFLDFQNILTTSQFFAETGLIALGMTFIIISGGIDLSVGSLLALVSVCVGFSHQAGLPLPFALVAGILIGVAGGFLNGFLVGNLGLSPLTVTLGTLSLFRGLAYLISDAGAVSDFPSWFAYFGQYFVGGRVPGQLIIFAVASLACGVLLMRTVFGRYVFGIGLNERTTRMSGTPILKVRYGVYALTGLLVAIAAIIYTSRVSTARANAGLGLELQAIAAVVLGGTDIKGGRGSIVGTVLGVLLLAFLNQGLALSGVSSPLSLAIQGMVLILAVFANEFLRNTKLTH